MDALTRWVSEPSWSISTRTYFLCGIFTVKFSFQKKKEPRRADRTYSLRFIGREAEV